MSQIAACVAEPANAALRCGALPIERDGARIPKIAAAGTLACYLPGDKGPAFMRLLERTFGTDITTRTMDTVRKCAWA